jgi:hypothetical protein
MPPSIAPAQLVELRSYTLVPGQAGAFVEHFERYFLASQQELGMDIVGQFTVPGDDARFVWVRRFRDPAARGSALSRFYGGPVWHEFGPRANELMVDYTDVHLLVPDRSAPAFAADHVPHARRSPAAGGQASAGDSGGGGAPTTVVAAVYDLAGAPGTGALPAELAEAMTVAGRDASAGGASEVGRLVSAGGPNDFPRLPVHEDATVAVWLLSDRAGGEAAVAAATAVATSQGLAVQTTRLTPTARSTLR